MALSDGSKNYKQSQNGSYHLMHFNLVYKKHLQETPGSGCSQTFGGLRWGLSGPVGRHYGNNLEVTDFSHAVAN